MARPLFDSEFIFGIHEPGGEDLMIQAGRPGWIVFTEEVGHNPNDRGGKNFTQWSSRNVGIICRLNNGYEPNGTIPNANQYQNFATRCANYVAASAGCKIWIIGNEMNFEVERPPAVSTRSATPAPTRSPAPTDAPQSDQPPPAPPETPRTPGPAERVFGTLFGRLLNYLSRGMGDAELFPDKRPTPPPPSPPLPPPTTARDADPFKHGAPTRFSALNPPSADDEPAPAAAEATRSAAIQSVGRGEPITPELYARCYRLCRDAIHGVPGHADDLVLIGGVAPWNDQTRYPGNPAGDWVQYLVDILNQLGSNNIDGITLHTYTHGADANLIHSDAKMNAPFNKYHFHFRAYQDFMNAIPATMRHLPVYITETDEDVPWLDRNIGWIQQAYGDIDHWNKQPGNQQIRALILYRWPPIDRWVITGKQGVIDDFKQALHFDYKWRDIAPAKPASPITVGGKVRTLDVVRLRRTAGYLNKPTNDVVADLPPSTELTVTGSSQSKDNLIWWPVRGKDGSGADISGWMAETAPGGQRLLESTGTPLAPAGKFMRNDTVRTLDVVRMRRTPGYLNKPADDTVAGIPKGTEAVILAGPSAVDGLTWWQVESTAPDGRKVTGWMAEATNGNSLLEKVGGTDDEGISRGEDFAVGDAARTLDVVRLRRTPGYNSKPATDVVMDIPAHTNVTVAGGPQNADHLVWWQIRLTDNGRAVSGWAAQSAPNGVTLLGKSDATPTPLPQATFKSGDRVRTRDVVRMRRSPGYLDKPASDVIADIWNDIQGTIRGGPQEDDNLTWWEVETTTSDGKTVRGWMADASPNGAPLLEKVSASTTPTPTPPNGTTGGTYRPGDLLVTTTDIRVRQSPGFSNKPASDVLGAFPARFTVNIIGGPRKADSLDWWRVGGITLTAGEVLGWVADSTPDGDVLIDMATRLPGTNIPNPVTRTYLHPPTERPFGTAQLFGENPQFYARFVVGGTPLRGHNGIDFLTPVGTPLLADEAGTIIRPPADPNGFGNWVLIQHSWGQSIYAHMDSIAVQHGDVVTRGDLLGTSGNTGASTGPHLHYAIRINPFQGGDGWGGFVDPLPYMPREFVILPDYVLPAPVRDLAPGVPPTRGGAAEPDRLEPSGMTTEIPEGL